MKYPNLSDLLSEDKGLRRYFLSLPTELQLSLHRLGEKIHDRTELEKEVHSLNSGGRFFNAISNPFGFLR